MKILLILIGVLTLTPSVFYAQAHKMLRKGDAEYLSKDYKTAEENYRKANEAQRTDKGAFNLGNSLYMQQRYDEAIKQYDDLANKSKSNELKANALYNKGNAYLWNKDVNNAEKAFKESLRLNPADEDAKRNLALVKKLKKQQQQQDQKNDKQNKDKNQKGDKQNKDKNDPKNQDKNQDKNQERQNQEQKTPDQEIDQNAQNERPENAQKQDLKKEEAKRMLQIMDDEERKVQQRLKKGKPKPSKSDKDW